MTRESDQQTLWEMSRTADEAMVAKDCLPPKAVFSMREAPLFASQGGFSISMYTKNRKGQD